VLRRHLVVTVGKDGAGVERDLEEGRLACPGCGAALVRWGWARSRLVFGLSGLRRVCPRRARCCGCGVTHVLLPVDLLVRRRDGVAVFGAVLLAAAAGVGYRRIAVRLGRPVGTVRGWLRRFRKLAAVIRGLFTGVQIALLADPPPLVPAGSEVADAVVAVLAARDAAWIRWPGAVVSAWEMASVVTGGTLLAPTITPRWINTSSPLPIL
jgi:hypothetical protein